MSGTSRSRFPRRSLLSVGAMLLLPLLLASLGVAGQTADRKINKNWRSIAIGGYDPVAYFTMGEAIKGNARFEHRWQDARWRFSSVGHLEMFAGDPDRYAPRFGGYCAEGMARGRSAKVDPEAWLIVDGELFLNFSVEARDEMARHPEETIERAGRFWEKLGSLVGAR